MNSSSVFERIASFQPWPRSVSSERRTSGKASQPGSESARECSTPPGAPRLRIASVRTSR